MSTEERIERRERAAGPPIADIDLYMKYLGVLALLGRVAGMFEHHLSEETLGTIEQAQRDAVAKYPERLKLVAVTPGRWGIEPRA